MSRGESYKRHQRACQYFCFVLEVFVFEEETGKSTPLFVFSKLRAKQRKLRYWPFSNGMAFSKSVDVSMFESVEAIVLAA